MSEMSDNDYLNAILLHLRENGISADFAFGLIHVDQGKDVNQWMPQALTMPHLLPQLLPEQVTCIRIYRFNLYVREEQVLILDEISWNMDYWVLARFDLNDPDSLDQIIAWFAVQFLKNDQHKIRNTQ